MRRCLPRVCFLIYKLRMRKQKDSPRNERKETYYKKIYCWFEFLPTAVIWILYFHVICFNGLGWKKLYSRALSRFPNVLGFQVLWKHSYCLNLKEFKLQELTVHFTHNVVYAECNTVCVFVFECDLVIFPGNYSKCFTTLRFLNWAWIFWPSCWGVTAGHEFSCMILSWNWKETP